MGGKIVDGHDKVIFEFEDNQPIEILLAGLLRRAKFGWEFQPDIVFNPWANALLKSLLESQSDADHASRADVNVIKAPQYYIDASMTDSDYGHRNFFDQFTREVAARPEMLVRFDWKNLDRNGRAKLLRDGLYPIEISDVCLDDMIEDIDMILATYTEAYNSKYARLV